MKINTIGIHAVVLGAGHKTLFFADFSAMVKLSREELQGALFQLARRLIKFSLPDFRAEMPVQFSIAATFRAFLIYY